ncbi:hypothetical protein [Arthrobacter sp. IK3]|uniref:hypothetical protein n=1 Tax=Arthrobacter sp. IK3 TaxID=3448169 RepID=UPI003EDF01D3
MKNNQKRGTTMIRKTVKCSVALAAALGLAASAAPAVAAPASVPAEATPAAGSAAAMAQDARTFLAEYGVDQPTIDALIASFEAGQTWDSLSGAEPVSTEAISEAGADKTVARYADGSVAVTSIQKPAAVQGGVAPQGVSDCKYARIGAEEHYDDCLVDFWAGLIYMGFRADYIARDNTTDSITAAYSPDYIMGGATSADETYFGVSRPDETVSGAPATARLSVQAFPAGVPIPFQFWVQLNVGYGGAYMTYSS